MKIYTYKWIDTFKAWMFFNIFMTALFGFALIAGMSL